MLKNLINLLFPNLCNGCHSLLLENETLICAKCRHELPLTQHHLNPNNYIAAKFYGVLPIEFCSAMLYFHKDGIVQNLIHQLKYKNKPEIGTLLGKWYAKELHKVAANQNFSAIIPVPLHQKKLKERGYNQVTSFCEALSQELHIELNDQLLIRTSYSKSQTKKNKADRAIVQEALFEAVFTASDHGKHFLLVDDVITSGATLEACGKALLKIPNATISILTIAYTDS
ncbi:ComF family protein [Flavobacterium sp.]|jgi:ComF family protein|uniref:ComF family protein n=1 Tax=Flavobacterium sp. TaxID=239 RepID=UPI0037BE4F29